MVWTGLSSPDIIQKFVGELQQLMEHGLCLCEVQAVINGFASPSRLLNNDPKLGDPSESGPHVFWHSGATLVTWNRETGWMLDLMFSPKVEVVQSSSRLLASSQNHLRAPTYVCHPKTPQAANDAALLTSS